MPETVAPASPALPAIPAASVTPVAPSPSAPPFQPVTYDFAGQKMTAATPEQAQQFGALHKSYVTQAQYVGSLNQKVAALEGRFAPAPAPQPTGPSPDEKRRFAERFGVFNDDGVYDEARQLAEDIADAKVQKLQDEVLQPMILDMRYKTQADECERKYPDFAQFKPQISDMIAQRSWVLGDAAQTGQNALEQYYLAIKGEALLRNPPPSTPNYGQVLQDPNARKQLFDDPNFAAAHQAYLAEKQRIAQGLPPAPIPSNPPAIPANAITSAKQASNALRLAMGLPV